MQIKPAAILLTRSGIHQSHSASAAVKCNTNACAIIQQSLDTPRSHAPNRMMRDI